MFTKQTRNIRIFIQVFSFIFPLLICPLIYAQGGEDPSVLFSDESQLQSEREFKKAVNLVNTGSYKEAENILLSFVGEGTWKEKAYFLLGRVYKEQDSFDKAEEYLKSYTEQGPLLKDYALKLLADIYLAKEEYDKAIETTRQIQNKTLLQEAKKSEVTALLVLKNEEAAMEVLSQYIKEYPQEYDYRLLLARLFKNNGKMKESIDLFKELYIDATPAAGDALKELKAISSDTFTREEMLRRAENLFKNGDFKGSEVTYKGVLKDISDAAVKDKIRFSVGMCQFRQKKYSMAAKSFGFIEGPETMYWQARALYRINDIDGFNRTIKRLEKEYPKSIYLAELLLILADEARRAGKLSKADEIFKRILNDFHEKSEDALWALGWMNYTNGNYKESERIFSKLTSSVKVNGRYLFWEAKSREMLSEDCRVQKVSLSSVRIDSEGGDNFCPEGNKEALSRLLESTDYYGFLAKARFKEFNALDKLEVSIPEIPEGEVYERIEALRFLGMNKEAIEEIKVALGFTKGTDEFMYLGHTAIELGEYKSIIYFVENTKDKEFLPLAYPLGFWNIIKDVAENEGVDPYLLVALIREESRFDPNAVSTAGAIGLMQLMPFTAHRIKKELKMELRDISELYDVKKNIFIGAHYLSFLIEEFKKVPLAIAAYNAGENALKRWLIDSNHKDMDEFIEDIPYQETRNYVKRVLKSYWQYRAINGLPIEIY